MTGAQAFVDDLSPQRIIGACVSENEWRMAGFDRRLLVPKLVPALATVARAVLRFLPERSFGSFSKDASAESGSREQTPRAA